MCGIHGLLATLVPVPFAGFILHHRPFSDHDLNHSTSTAHEGRNPSSSTRNLVQALLRTQTKIATEPRDKMFAVRSLFPTVFGTLEIDYNKTVATVYADATRRITEFTQGKCPDSDTLLARMVQFFGLGPKGVDELTKILKLVMTDNPREGFPEGFDAMKKTLQDSGFGPPEIFNSQSLDVDVFTAVMLRSETMAEFAWTFFFLEGQRLFVTESGEISLSRHDIRPNDSLMLLQTTSAPFIIRKKEGRRE